MYTPVYIVQIRNMKMISRIFDIFVEAVCHSFMLANNRKQILASMIYMIFRTNAGEDSYMRA